MNLSISHDKSFLVFDWNYSDFQINLRELAFYSTESFLFVKHNISLLSLIFCLFLGKVLSFSIKTGPIHPVLNLLVDTF